jgi:hypothetical protein
MDSVPGRSHPEFLLLNSLASAAERSEHTTTVEGIEKYLGSGMIRGIGPVYAKKLVRAFGEVVFDVIEQEPIPSGISPPSAPAAYSLKSPNASGSRVALTGARRRYGAGGETSYQGVKR